MMGPTPTPGMDIEISARIYLQVMQLTNLVKVPPFNDPNFFGPILHTSIELMDRMARVRNARKSTSSGTDEEKMTALTTFVTQAKGCLDCVVRLLVPCASLTWRAVESYADAGRAIIKFLASPDVIAELPHNRLQLLTDFIEAERTKWIQSFFSNGITLADLAVTEERLFDFCRDFLAFSLYLKAPVIMILREQTEKEALKIWSTPESRFVKWRFEQR